MIKANLPELTKVYNEGMKKDAEQQAKKPPQKEPYRQTPKMKSV